MRRSILTVTAAAALALPAVATAHVTVHPNDVPAGGYTVLSVRVPNEEAKAYTTKVVVQMPRGFVSASTAPVPGWSAKPAFRKLATPVKTDDGSIDSEVSRITWTATGKGLAPGQFMELPISVGIPDTAKTPLTFKALQTYSDGEVARWIGAPDADKPAPQIAVAAKDAAISDVPVGAVDSGSHPMGATTSAATAQPASKASSGGGGASKGLAITALVVGALGLLAGGASLVASRRRSATA